MQVTPYLMLDGRCEEALEFYKQAVGAEIGMVMRFNEAPDQAGCPPNASNKIMHSSFKVGDTLLMATDGDNNGKPTFAGVSLAVTVKDEAEADKVFAALSAGGQVQMPLAQTFFAKKFGVLADKFGVNWMIVTE